MVNFNNLNPFKKKENEFKLDEHTLPSLSDIDTNSSGSGSGLPNSSSLPPLESSSSNDFSLNSVQQDSLTPMPELPPMGSGLGGSNPMSQDNNFNPTPNPITNFGGSNGSGNVYGTNMSQNSSSMDAQISKAKLEAMDSKVTLIDARLSSIEQKLELLTRLILEEVSDETKRKLNVETMVKSIK